MVGHSIVKKTSSILSQAKLETKATAKKNLPLTAWVGFPSHPLRNRGSVLPWQMRRRSDLKSNRPQRKHQHRMMKKRIQVTIFPGLRRSRLPTLLNTPQELQASAQQQHGGNQKWEDTGEV